MNLKLLTNTIDLFDILRNAKTQYSPWQGKWQHEAFYAGSEHFGNVKYKKE